MAARLPRATFHSPVQSRFGVAWYAVAGAYQDHPDQAHGAREFSRLPFGVLLSSRGRRRSERLVRSVGSDWLRCLSDQIKDVEKIRRIPHFSHHRQTRESFQFFAGDIVKSMQPFISCEPLPFRGRSLRHPPLAAGLGPQASGESLTRAFPD